MVVVTVVSCGLLVLWDFRYPPFPDGRDVGSGQQGQAAPGYLFCENFHGFSFLKGILELFHFKGVKISLFLGLGNEPIVHEFKCNFNLSFWAILRSNLIQFS